MDQVGGYWDVENVEIQNYFACKFHNHMLSSYKLREENMQTMVEYIHSYKRRRNKEVKFDESSTWWQRFVKSVPTEIHDLEEAIRVGGLTYKGAYKTAFGFYCDENLPMRLVQVENDFDEFITKYPIKGNKQIVGV